MPNAVHIFPISPLHSLNCTSSALSFSASFYSKLSPPSLTGHYQETAQEEFLLKNNSGNSLVIQWLGPGSILGQGTFFWCSMAKKKKKSSYLQNFLSISFIDTDIVHFSPVIQLCPTICDPMDCSTPGLPVHHQLPELTQTHVHWVGDAIQSSHPLSPPSPPAFSLSQYQGLFQRVSSLHQVAKVL